MSRNYKKEFDEFKDQFDSSLVEYLDNIPNEFVSDYDKLIFLTILDDIRSNSGMNAIYL